MSFSVDDQTPPFSFVMIEGTAEVAQEPDKGELLKWATKIAERYVGSKAGGSSWKRDSEHWMVQCWLS